MLSRREWWKRNDEGAQLVELAVVMLLLLLILMGVSDIGRAFYSYISIANAAREGARYGSRFPNDLTGIRFAAKEEAKLSGVTLADASIIANCPGGCLGGQRIQVEVNYSVPTILGGVFGFNPIPMLSRAEMIIFGLDPPPSP